ncbi:hypothetical protein FNYG_14756 [Fusarium nygamai]|uniref:Uncharacterized protein n=1 Tax=Gibberella nygamai TaxID=42673 RepID=A0A2K0UQ50_GIBNY|nr:hypothetical protein FNYG_14756 [Fusarium nygamai]
MSPTRSLSEHTPQLASRSPFSNPKTIYGCSIRGAKINESPKLIHPMVLADWVIDDSKHQDCESVVIDTLHGFQHLEVGPHLIEENGRLSVDWLKVRALGRSKTEALLECVDLSTKDFQDHSSCGRVASLFPMIATIPGGALSSILML